MTAHRRALLEAACRSVTVDDIRAHTIGIDPGYPAYVERLTAVRASRGQRGLDAVDWEPIFHALGDEPSDDVARRRYRIFLAATGALHPALGELISPNEVAVTLVEEGAHDPRLARRCHDALEELSHELCAFDDREAAFVLLGCVLLAPGIGQPEHALVAMVERLRDEEAKHRGAGKRKARPAFLWSCTSARRAFPRWRRCIEQHLPTSLADLRVELLGP